jgi:hypothetical protein
MSLPVAMMVFLAIVYVAGSILGGTATYYSTLWVTLVCGLIGGIVVYCVHKVTVNSLEIFFNAAVKAESSRLCFEHSEEALTLLAKKKYEDLKIHLVEKSAAADDAIRNITLEYGEPPIK